MEDRRLILAVSNPRETAAATLYSIVSSKCISLSSSSSSVYRSGSNRFSTSPSSPESSMRMAFWSDSSKVRPTPITSPTDFMVGPSFLSTRSNFAKSHRGCLHTT